MSERTFREEAALIAFKVLLETSDVWRQNPDATARLAAEHADAMCQALGKTPSQEPK